MPDDAESATINRRRGIDARIAGSCTDAAGLESDPRQDHRYAQQGENVPEIAKRLELCKKTTRLWLKRFNELGLKGLEESPRSGRPPIYPPEQIAVVVQTALTKPAELDQPVASWTLDRLEAYINEVKGIPIKRSRISEIFLAEGLGWRHEESWFGERVDPDFAQKRSLYVKPFSSAVRKRKMKPKAEEGARDLQLGMKQWTMPLVVASHGAGIA